MLSLVDLPAAELLECAEDGTECGLVGVRDVQEAVGVFPLLVHVSHQGVYNRSTDFSFIDFNSEFLVCCQQTNMAG